MSKPFFDQVRQLRKGQFLADSGEALREVKQYVDETRKTGQIGFWYEMQRPEQVVEDTAKAIVEKLKNGTGFPVLFGKP